MSAPGAVSFGRWILACAAAETIGMGVSAAAARLGQDVADGPQSAARWLALGVVVAGGLVEGTALGVLQGQVLGTRWPRLSRFRYALLTVLVAGLGWAGASAPSVLGGGEDTSGPPVVLMVLGGLGLGLLMGPVLGLAQATALRGVVRHPWRWVVASTAAWPPAMALIFTGASTAGAHWSLPVLAAYGAATGALAGAALGLVSSPWLAALDGQPIANQVALAMVAGRRLGAHRRLVGLGVVGRHSGLVSRFPVQFAQHGTDLVVVPGHPAHKTWWHNLGRTDTMVWVLDGSGWHPATGRVLLPEADGHAAALASYRRRWTHFDGPPDQPVVVLHLVGPGIPAGSGRF
ncbi:nitroreductase/quinone reductase family protein [Nocardioides pocheonensis]|uniref:nitroreductase/quinone reductase family protein n=1 Tax=Nocardioides pocheonensis TaxID=661485 RepID=UPI0011CE53EB|nr:nitroreductase/quinone reductase family protein [Nocardioides pocheonensis]